MGIKCCKYPVLVRLISLVFLCYTAQSLAQNGMVGDGFGGRLWYKPCKNLGVGSYHGFSYCLDSGILVSWGLNNEKQFGTGTINNSNTPVRAKNISGIRYVSAGYCVAAITKSNEGWAWASRLSTMPVKVIDSVKYAHGGSLSAQFIKDDGTVWAVGNNRFGMFGHDSFLNMTFPSFSKPVMMNNMTNAVRVTSTDGALGVLRKDGTVWTVGSNLGGKLGIDSANNNLVLVHPVKVKYLKNIIDLKSTQATFIALDDTGYVYTWGAGGEGAVGNGGTYDAKVPERVKSLKDIVAVSACDDGYHFLALDKNKNCYAWGKNNFFLAGFFDSTKKDLLVPRLMATDVIDIMAGEMFAYLVKTDGSLWAIGTNMGTIKPKYLRDYNSSIWMNLSDTPRYQFTKIQPMGAPMNLCKIENDNIGIKNKIKYYGLKCAADSIEFQAEDTANYAKFTWNFGDNTAKQFGKKVKHHFSNPGKYGVSLISTSNDFGLIDTTQTEITIPAVVKAKFTQSDTVQCAGAARFVLTDISGAKIKNRNWKIVNYGTFSDSILNIQIDTPAVYKAMLITTSMDGCTDTAALSFRVVALPKPRIIANSDTQCLENNLFKYKSTDQLNSKEWTFYDNKKASGDTVSRHYPTTGSFKVILKVKSKEGCVAADSVYSKVIKATVNASVSSDTNCFKQKQLQFQTKPDKLSYSWNMGDGFNYTLPSFQHNYQQAGKFKVTLVVNDSFGCKAFDTIEILIKDSLRINFSSIQKNCSGIVEFQDQSTGTKDAKWRIESKELKGSIITHTFADTGSFPVALMVIDSTGLCHDTLIKIVKISSISGMDFMIPNVFTPGADGFNDCYTLKGLDSMCNVKTSMKIFSRWGVLVYNGNILQECWNGRVLNRGSELPSGTYFYQLTMEKTEQGKTKKQTFTGAIELIR